MTPSHRFKFLGIDFVTGDQVLDLKIDQPNHVAVLAKTGMPIHFQSTLSLETLASQAAKKLLNRLQPVHGLPSAIIVVTQSSEYHLPSVACTLQTELGLPTQILAFDINQGCSGFVQALTIAVSILESFERVLIVCADKYRSKLTPGDRSTESVFSDAAAAVLIEREGPMKIVAQSHYTDGSGRKSLVQPIGGSLKMLGAEVYLWTRRQVAPQIQKLADDLSANGHYPKTVFMHQASKLVVDALKVLLPNNLAVPTNLHQYGNTVSASIPILIKENLHLLEQGTSILAGFGVGLSSSCIALTHSP